MQTFNYLVSAVRVIDPANKVAGTYIAHGVMFRFGFAGRGDTKVTWREVRIA